MRFRGVRRPKQMKVLGPLGLSALGTIELGEELVIINDTKYNRAGINHPTQLVATQSADQYHRDALDFASKNFYLATNVKRTQDVYHALLEKAQP